MSTETPTKPSYLGLLNALAVAETAAEPLFLAWADATKDKDLAKTLRFVAMREGEHGKAFAKRMLELGYEVRAPEPTSQQDEAIALVTSDRSDIAKFKALKFNKAPGATDVFDSMFADKTIDPTTGAILGRYIAEERDSGRRLAAEYERLTKTKKSAGKSASAKKTRAKKSTAAKKSGSKKAKAGKS